MTIEPTNLRLWNRAALVAGLAAGAIAFAACGDDGGPQGSAGVANAGSEAGTSDKAAPADDQDRLGEGEGAPANESQSGKGKAKEAAGSPSAATAAPGKGRSGSAKDDPATRGEAESAGKGPGRGGKNLPQPSSLPNSSTPPPITAKSVYEMAKGICSDPQILEFVPEEQRDDPESIAKMAEVFAPAGMQREAYEGCLAGLRSQGL